MSDSGNNRTQKAILVVEDHQDSCEVLKLMLRRRGLRAECAESYAEAISCLEFARQQGNPYDCVVSDLQLKDSAPLQTIEKLKRLNEYLPVRAISGIQDPEVIEACRLAKIPLILKGTSAEGIMESVLYAISERRPDHDLFEMIAANRKPQREILPSGFFSNWSSTGKAFAIAGVIISTFSGAIALGATLYQSLESKVVKSEQVKEHFAQIDQSLSVNKLEREAIALKVRTVEDTNIKVAAKLDELAKVIDSNKTDYTQQLNRIEGKLGNGR